MDDTNPTKEDIEYVESIRADVNLAHRCLGGQEAGLPMPAKGAILRQRLFRGQIYEFAVGVINKGKGLRLGDFDAETDRRI